MVFLPRLFIKKFISKHGRWFQIEMLAEELKCGVNEIADFELGVYDTKSHILSGVCNDFVFISRFYLAYCALSTLLDVGVQNHHLSWMKPPSTWWHSSIVMK
jgi:aspartyl aminopeptidase